MKATYKVVDTKGITLGYMIDNKFYNKNTVKNNLENVDNITLLSNGTLRCVKALPEISYQKAIIDKTYNILCKQNPFKRDIQVDFDRWRKNYSQCVLQLDGPRQVGKTTELLKFAYKNYSYVIYVDISDDNTSKIFDKFINSTCSPLDMDTLCLKLNLPNYVNDRSTIFIIDEIQKDHGVYNSIRKMHRNLECDIVITGSYLGRILGDKDFFLPAGTIALATMLPLSFSEFCEVFNSRELLESVDLYGGSSDDTYNKLNTLYKTYLKIGGYPAVVSKYIETKDIKECGITISWLLNLFANESRVYLNSPREVEIFDQVYDEAMNLMLSESKGSGKNITQNLVDKIKEDNVKAIVSRKEVANAVVWLRHAGILSMCDLVRDGDMDKPEYDRRMYFTDCGIAYYIACNKRNKEMNNDNITDSQLVGLLSETFVHSELLRLYKVNYKKDKKVLSLNNKVCFGIFNEYELDFMVKSVEAKVYGIEVKSKDGTYTSLKVFLNRKMVDKGIVAKYTKGSHAEKFDVIPIYTVGCRFPYK